MHAHGRGGGELDGEDDPADDGDDRDEGRDRRPAQHHAGIRTHARRENHRPEGHQPQDQPERDIRRDEQEVHPEQAQLVESEAEGNSTGHLVARQQPKPGALRHERGEYAEQEKEAGAGEHARQMGEHGRFVGIAPLRQRAERFGVEGPHEPEADAVNDRVQQELPDQDIDDGAGTAAHRLERKEGC